MKIIECEQGTHEWHQARLGIPTASKIHVLFAPTGKQTANETRRTYARELAVERITKRPADSCDAWSMIRGRELEPEARIRYYLDTKRSIEQVGFAIADSELTGSSPDGLVGDDGAIEIKCFELKHYAKIIATGELDHAIMMQCHHTLYVTGRAWIDFVLYTDVEPFSNHCWIKRIERDESICSMIEQAVADFSEEINECERLLIERARLTPDMLMFEAPVFNDRDMVDMGTNDTKGGDQ